jgi:hypothetical protein
MTLVPDNDLTTLARAYTDRLLEIADAEPDRWWDAREICNVAGVHGAVAMYALTRLANPEHDGRLELDSNLRVRLRSTQRRSDAP